MACLSSLAVGVCVVCVTQVVTYQPCIDMNTNNSCRPHTITLSCRCAALALPAYRVAPHCTTNSCRAGARHCSKSLHLHNSGEKHQNRILFKEKWLCSIASAGPGLHAQAHLLWPPVLPSHAAGRQVLLRVRPSDIRRRQRCWQLRGALRDQSMTRHLQARPPSFTLTFPTINPVH